MRCKACDRILEDSELTRKDVHGNFLDLCGVCLSASATAGVDTQEVMEYYPDGSLTLDDDYDTLY
jgi:hypothetical protein